MACGLLLLLLAAPQESAERVSIRYDVDVSAPETGKILVRMTVEGVRDPEVSVAIPAWAPGAYRIVKYHKNISGVSGEADGKNFEVQSVDPLTWKVATAGASPFTISYTVSMSDTSRGGITKEHCDIQGPDTYLYVVDRKTAPCSAVFTIPSGWRIATGLERKDGVYHARDYDTFIDCPTEIGHFDRHEFEAGGAKHEVVVHSIGKYDADGLVELCRKIVREQIRLFGSAPYRRYVFLFHFRNLMGGGGLEHLNSTSISMPYAVVKTSIASVASVTSHEFFHLWNVKRLRPKLLGPFDYTGPVRTNALWLCEGGTSYYGDVVLARSGVWNRQAYLRSLEAEIETLQNNPDRPVTSVEKASWTAWDDSDGPRISYYNKGLLVALLLDLRIRQVTDNAKSLDDVLRHLYDRYVVHGGGPIGVGYEETGIEQAVKEVSGHDFADFFRTYVSGVEELPYRETLPIAGIDCDLQVRESPDLGVPLRGTRVTTPPAGTVSPLRKDDRILKINGEEVNRENIRDVVKKLKVGAEVTLLVGREEKEIKIKTAVGKRERTNCTLKWSEKPDETQRKIRESWLTGNP